ncbi:sigma-54-dependent transcriptional regulator [Massilia psychrophila]|uniref:Sigma-54-dependent Fis family transcriptional regulator n=1 Tax=Massilia psychrophila TaxID=1603353 RepID=A0A2G8T1D0_9BURK|nr:sigma-54 dependent transcriptional regulator [Massilia psychrophila]PIL39860.1 sigma-54-dependent Fis family transcriptional regulator [Massilia psychrophila]GGE80386.1 sigma-54-dependent Fis family transcriptional regulator [Massilia psychrophila]
MADNAASILILDDDPDVACAAQLLLRRLHGKVATLNDPAGLAAVLAAGVPDVVLLDLNFTPGRIDGAQGLALLDQLRAQARPPAVIALTAYADVPLAVEALKRGASDFITKPWDNARLVAAVANALARRAGAAPSSANTALMGESAPMRDVKAMVAGVGPTEANVMILGENGVGKELVARAIHAASRRAGATFLAIDMGALPESTFESELFGHRRGAFTDAKADRAGRFQAARGGSLFLDEIGNMALAGQAKLLTVLERREVTPLGADRAEAIDVRIVSATNLDETRLFDPAVFRPDLLFRLNTIVIRVPPLRERRDDIPALLGHYLALYERQYGRPARMLADGALDRLHRFDWPGNVRALRHACERAVILGSELQYGFADFGLADSHRTGAAVFAAPAPKPAALELFQLGVLERDTIAAALEQAKGNISHAAKMLGVSRAALYRKLGKHGI